MRKRTIVYIAFIIVLIVLANISVYYYLYFDNIRKNSSYKTELIINEKTSVTYNIETSDKNYYNSKNITDYDVNKLNKVDSFFNYTVTFDKTVNGTYSYYLRGVVLDTMSNEKEVYKSDEYKYELNDKNVININHLNSIEVKNLINNTKEITNMYDAHIKYELVVKYHIYNKELNKYIFDGRTLEIDIPITSGKPISVSPYEEKNYKEYSNELDRNNNTYLFICLEFLGSVILYILCIAYLIERISPKDYMNDKELKHILTKYKKYIIEISFLPDLSYKEVIFVDDMDELVLYSKKYHVPIDFIEAIKNKEYVFAVIIDKTAYVYKVGIKKRK